MKLSKTQQNVLEQLRKTIEVVSKYATHEDFFDNSKNEQSTFTTALHCNGAYNSSEKYKEKDAAEFARMAENFYRAKNEHITIVFAKTETINALEKAGYVKVIKHATYRGGAETVKVL